MINKKNVLIAVVVFAVFVLFISQASAMATTSTTTTTTTPGGVVVVQNYRGAPFTWERWLKPVIYVWVEAGKTLNCVFNPNNTDVNTCNK